MADYLELRALLDPDHCTSSTQLHTDALMGGLDFDPRDDEMLSPSEIVSNPQTGDEGVASDTLAIIERRITSCGLDGNYPFKLEGETVSLPSATSSPVYIFLLCLSTLAGRAPSHAYAAKLFEELSAVAAETYLGHDNSINPGASSYVFGYPRRIGPPGFAAAVDHLCGGLALNEAEYNRADPKGPYQNDARLDVVAWRDFHDGRRGRSVLFGQCATGENWEEKANSLDPDAWQAKWLIGRFLPMPNRGFFVPHFVEEREWRHTLLDGGLLFERCRITALTAPRLQTRDPDLEDEIRSWLPYAEAALREQAGL